MANNIHALKGRIESIEKTASITNAMYRISSSKLMATQNTFSKYQIFKESLDDMLDDVISTAKNHIFIKKQSSNLHKLYIVISADRGLVGGYHHSLFKAFLKEIEDIDRKYVHIVAIGKKAFSYFKKHQFDVINQSPIYSQDYVDSMDYQMYVDLIEKEFIKQTFGEVIVFYNHFINAMTFEAKKETILPLAQRNEVKKDNEHAFIHEGELEKIIEDFILIFLESRIYGVLVDAKMSEFSARIQSMKRATDNAKDALSALKLKYHQARQQKITNDLLDISNGKSLS